MQTLNLIQSLWIILTIPNSVPSTDEVLGFTFIICNSHNYYPSTEKEMDIKELPKIHIIGHW